MVLSPSDYKVAVFSPEWGITPIGGLGILVDDMLKSATRLKLPVMGVSIFYHEGSFRQVIDKDGWQHEEDISFRSEEIGLKLIPEKIKTKISGREVAVGAYVHERDPTVLYLTTNLPENTEWDRGLTARPYDDGNGNKHYYRTAQYRILASGVRLLQELGYENIETYHLNEGHTALVALELLNRGLKGREGFEGLSKEEIEEIERRVKEKIWFTTHTPLDAALDHFDSSQVEYALPNEIGRLRPYFDGKPYFGTAEFAIRFSRGINAVSKKHAEVCSGMDIFKGVNIFPITNGIHLPTWVHPAKATFYESQLPRILENPERFKEAASFNYEGFGQAHRQAQKGLFDLIQQETGVRFQEGYLTIGFARRAVPYKRADLILHDTEALARIMKDKAQIVFAGKAHPADTEGKKMIQRVWQGCKELREKYGVNAVYLPNYGRDVAKVMAGAVDAWLNNPEMGIEASGTSGMKVAANGGVNISNKDGWNYEGLNEKNGFVIDSENQGYESVSRAILDLLEHQVIPQFGSEEWKRKVIESLKIAASFNTDRVVREYAEKAYGLTLEERIDGGQQESRLVA